MLSDAERRSLDEIEQRLSVEEPDLARAFESGRVRNAWLYYVVMIVFGGIGALLLVIGSPGIGLLCLLVAAVTAVLRKHPVGIG
ncbi:hypothetical protein Lesp02_45370 [Lentzea sp. NBRC 105346]|uniref:DUF3040 domain-containing protein n=1 Tax=Lentzea sp. NBRC 105346 TaxID=3032205 RepID=UPI0024A3C99F|nr:DUF3040 domain-containing protein [Lentzea sp. NBRC 105346]GLZ32349.1 hypothetical protein Lesp02_45370 [Lentzea sp. NBRC 105346]